MSEKKRSWLRSLGKVARLRTLQAPDWGYFGSVITVVTIGLGLLLMNSNYEFYQPAGVALVLLGVILLPFSLRPTLRSMFGGRGNPPLSFKLGTTDLDGLWRKENPGAVGLSGRVFAAVTVRNEGEKDILRLTAQCQLGKTEDGAPAEGGAFWSHSLGPLFVLGSRDTAGTATAEIPAGADRQLVFTFAYITEKLWARLPARQASIWHIVRVSRESGRDVTRLLAGSEEGNHLEAGAEAVATLRFRAEGVDQKVQFALGFDDDGRPTMASLPLPQKRDRPKGRNQTVEAPVVGSFDPEPMNATPAAASASRRRLKMAPIASSGGSAGARRRRWWPPSR